VSPDVRSTAENAFLEEDLTPQTWSNEPGFRYGEHSHPYHKVLFCIEGAITFHTPDGDVSMSPGDRLDLPPGTSHSATVGPDGVTCMEAARS
jgi:quercetin dioxygenase-like cupin family protein